MIPKKDIEIGRALSNLELSLCQRDYTNLVDYYPDIARDVETAVDAGATPQEVRRRARLVTQDHAIATKLYNAARWLEHLKEEPTVEKFAKSPVVYQGTDVMNSLIK